MPDAVPARYSRSIPPRFLSAKLDDFSLHQLPTSNLLRELQETCGVEVRVLACQTGPLPEEISQGLSKVVSGAVPQAAEWLVREYFPRAASRSERHFRSTVLREAGGSYEPESRNDQRWKEVHVGWAALLSNREEASRAAESYQNENFQVQMVEEDGKFLVYTRRTVKEWCHRSSGRHSR